MELKKNLSDFAKLHKLDLALIAVWEEIENYDSRSKRTDFCNMLNVNDIVKSVEKDKENNEIKVAFKWKETPFEILYKEEKCWLPDESWNNAIFNLVEQGELVFKIETKIDYDYCKTFGSASIDAFKKKGLWGQFLIDSWTLIQIDKQKWNIQSRYYGADDIRDKFHG